MRASFPFVYSLGVLQHTPDVAAAFAALPPMLAPGGRLVVDFYERSLKSRLLPRYLLRPLTTRMDKARLFGTLERVTPALMSVSEAVRRIPGAGRYFHRIVPVANYTGMLPLTEEQLQEWALLDTFDWLAPAYDYPQTAETVQRWLDDARLEQTAVLKAGHLVGRGRKPASPGAAGAD
jgi:hypothetical protein